MEYNRSKFWYLLFVVVGFVITVALINYFTQQRNDNNHVENFVDAPPETQVVQQIDPEEIILDLPRKSKLALYLTAFSEPATFQCDTNYWCDAVDPTRKFFLLSDTTLPSTLTPASGLPLTGVMLRGPSAYTLSPTAPHILGSFTLVFYAKINSLSVLDGPDGKIVLWDLPAESPHRIQLFIRPTYNTDGTVDNTKAGVSCTFGSECELTTTTNVWEFDRNTLIGSVNTPTLFALVFDKENNKMQFYAGINTTPENPKQTDFIGGAPEIKLGISEMTINRPKNWDANLVAMAFYNMALPIEDLRTMDKYFMQHSTGYSTMVRAKETLESEIQTLMSRLNTGEDTIRQLLDKLNAANQSCSNTAASSDMASKLLRWQISMQGNADISNDDLGKCSILGVKSFGAKAAEIASTSDTSTTSTTANTQTTPSKTRKYNIPYPSEVTSATPSTSIYNTSTSNSTSTSSPAAPASPSSPVDQNDPNGFWKSFFDFLKNQQEKTEETEEKTDLNKAYDELRDEVSTDKTQPGSGKDLVASVQDPPKKEEPVVQEETTSGFWQTIKNIFADL
jgi:hypothetical protein